MNGLFISSLFDDPFFYLSWVIILCFSICFHEFGHAWTALKLGDDTAARQGHLSLNPLVQMGHTSLIFLALMGIAWGSVPVNPRRYPSNRDWALVAAAGPGMNALLAIVFSALLVLVGAFMDGPAGQAVSQFCWIGTVANVFLVILNLLPIPIFDGWSVLSWAVPAARKLDPATSSQIAMFALIVLFISPAGGLLWKGAFWAGSALVDGWGAMLGAMIS